MNPEQFHYYDYIHHGTFVLASNFDIVFWNKALENLSGINKENATGKSILALFPRLSQAVYSERIQNVFDGGPPTIFSALLHKYFIPCELKDGSLRTQHTTLIPYRDIQSDEIFVIVSIQDVTAETVQLEKVKKHRDLALHEVSEREKVEKILRESEQELKVLNANKDKLFSIIGHDLKNPFQAILSFSEILIEEYSELDKDEIFEMIKMIGDSSQSAFKLLENLLHWARAQTGRLTFEPENINILDMAKQIKTLVEVQAQNKDIKILIDINPEHIVYADKNMLETIIRNLATNAIKFTNAEGEIKFYSALKENVIEFTVQDSGIGMTDNDVNKLFRIDVKNNEIGSSNEKGTGLGLILCKELVEKNGGTIRVVSTKDIGSKFIFTVPVKS